MKFALHYLIIMILLLDICYSNERDDVFKLGATPFINSGKYDLFFSYGQNYGSAGAIVDEWILPNDNKKTLFEEYRGGFSFNEVIQFVVSYSKYQRLWFGYLHTGVPVTLKLKSYGLKFKMIKSDDWFPDISVTLRFRNYPKDLVLPLSLSFGSYYRLIQYYINIDFYPTFFFIPYPNRYSAGLSLSPLKYFRIFGELVKEPYYGGGSPDILLLRYGLNVKLTPFISIDIAYFHFKFDFFYAIPGRTGLTWQDPTHVITVPEKDNYNLLSWSINFHINEDIFKRSSE